MHLKVVILCSFLFCAIYSAPRKFEDTGSGYVMIGQSRDVKPLTKSDEKFHRSAHHITAYPLYLHHPKPSSDYQVNYPGHHHYGNPSTSLISANINLLEPFMLATFLMFVLSLLEKVLKPALFRRQDQIQMNERLNLTDIEAHDWNEPERKYFDNPYMKMLEDQNSTHF